MAALVVLAALRASCSPGGHRAAAAAAEGGAVGQAWALGFLAPVWALGWVAVHSRVGAQGP